MMRRFLLAIKALFGRRHAAQRPAGWGDLDPAVADCAFDAASVLCSLSEPGTKAFFADDRFEQIAGVIYDAVKRHLRDGECRNDDGGSPKELGAPREEIPSNMRESLEVVLQYLTGARKDFSRRIAEHRKHCNCDCVTSDHPREEIPDIVDHVGVHLERLEWWLLLNPPRSPGLPF